MRIQVPEGIWNKLMANIGWHGYGENDEELYCEYCCQHHPDSELIEHKQDCIVVALRMYDKRKKE